jgi:hypothetical protein
MLDEAPESSIEILASWFDSGKDLVITMGNQGGITQAMTTVFCMDLVLQSIFSAAAVLELDQDELAEKTNEEITRKLASLKAAEAKYAEKVQFVAPNGKHIN